MPATRADDPSGPATVEGAHRLPEILGSVDRAAWTGAALSLVLAADGAPVPDDPADSGRVVETRAAATQVLHALGVALGADAGGLDRRALAAQAAAPLLQTAALLTGAGALWAEQSDAAILAQGRASAQGARAFVEFGLPMLSGVAEAMAAPGARMLDVGTGVAALAVAYAEQFPALTVVGIDVLPRVFALATQNVRSSAVAERVELREQDVSTLDDHDAYALAFLPAPFVPQHALEGGVRRIARALIPGGWLMLAHGKFADDPVENALTRFKTIAYGGTALDDTQAQDLLRTAGLVEIMTPPTPPGAPAITVGRRDPLTG
jgi:SAM-dependent methyltransferase